MNMINKKADVVVIGAGLTGLTASFHLSRRGKNVMVVERQRRIGGQIQSYNEDGFIFESGPNTGVISHPEVAELFSALGDECHLEVAREEAKRRLIWKDDAFHPLPSGIVSAVTTPLFTFHDKFRILGEPFRKKGTNPDESVGELASRRLGKSFVNYAVDPFLSGVYAGDPWRLVTRYALPKLYNLEQQYGSFIKGSIAKAKQPKTAREQLASKKVFSVKGGLSSLAEALYYGIGTSHFLLGSELTIVKPLENGHWLVICQTRNSHVEIETPKVVTTVGAYALPELLPFVPQEEMKIISSLKYAPIVQVSVGVRNTGKLHFNAFGGLVPSCEQQDVLGILYPSACFAHRSPALGALFSFFIGGVKHPEIVDKSDEEIRSLIDHAFHSMLKFPTDKHPDMVRIFRHKQAIPQYGVDCGERWAAVERVEKTYAGLTIAGNLRGGIGMADRIRQGAQIAASI